MLVACLLAVTASAAALQGPYVPTRDLAAEAEAVAPLRTRMSGGDPRKVSTISFYKNSDGLTSHFQWNAFSKTTVTTITIGRPEAGPYLANKPAWADRSTLLGFDAVTARVGAVRSLEDSDDWSEAGWWIGAKPYVVSVRIMAGQDLPKVWDIPTWRAHSEAAKSLAESAIHLLADGGFLPLNEEKVDGALVVTAETTTGAPVANLRVHLSLPGRREPLVATTDGSGRVKVAIPILRPDGDAEGSVVAMTYTETTKAGGVPLHIVDSLKLAVDNPFKLLKKDGFKGSLALRCFVRPIYVKVERTDSTDPVEDCTVTLLQDDLLGRPLIRVQRWEKVPRDAGGRLALRMPVTRTNGGRPAVVLATAQIDGKPAEGWEEIELPSNTVESAAAIIELGPIDLASQMKRYQPRLQETLEAAGFSAEEIGRILAVKFRIGASNNYKDGVIQVVSGTQLRQASENVLHEIGHLITDVIAPDEPGNIGGTHEVTDSIHVNKAWDEGRAHFYSTLLGQVVGLPGAKTIATSPAGIDNCENLQLFVQKALFEHYGNRALFPSPAAALANFREVHRRGAEQLGRPPRTMEEFLNVANAMPGATDADRADLAWIRRSYGIGTPN